MLGSIGMPEMLVIGAIALLIFGPSRLAELGSSLGKGIRNFKSAMAGEEDATHAAPPRLARKAPKA